jgi:hypothetical protein
MLRFHLTPVRIATIYIDTMEFHSATMMNEILSFAGKLMEQGNIILSEASQDQIVNSCMLSLICGTKT